MRRKYQSASKKHRGALLDGFCQSAEWSAEQREDKPTATSFAILRGFITVDAGIPYSVSTDLMTSTMDLENHSKDSRQNNVGFYVSGG